MSKQDIVQTQQTLEKFRNNFSIIKDQVLFIFLGSTNHWVISFQNIKVLISPSETEKQQRI